MATRILVVCRSHQMPGSDREKNKIMADLACQAVWGRDFDEFKGDRVTTRGGYFLYNQTCELLIDNGPVDATSYDMLWFNWKQQKLVRISQELPEAAIAQLRSEYSFNPSERPAHIGYTDEEYGEKFGQEKLQELKDARKEKYEIAKRFCSSSSNS